MTDLALLIPVLSVAGTAGIISAALALGIRHGIDWDHIAAITDITSTTAALETEDKWLTKEPAFMLTDESHHPLVKEGEVALDPHTHGGEGDAVAVAAPAHSHGPLPGLHHPHATNGHGGDGRRGGIETVLREQRPALLLGTMYALGHGSIVFVLGMLAILAREVLPDWIDPIMEKVVGVTLLFLAAYLFYSLWRFFRGGGEFQMRSRWMLVFAGVRNGWAWLRAKLTGNEHHHHHATQQYGVATAFGIGLIHGIGAETGTQALVIATAVGAASQTAGIVALAAFIVGLLISNTIVTVVSTVGFVSSRQRQWIYVAAGVMAAVFSLVVGLFFLLDSSGLLPDLDKYFEWIGGPA